MLFYYRDKEYPCNWKTQMRKDMFYSMEPVKLRIRVPITTYDTIMLDIKNDEDNNTLLDIMRFKILYFKQSNINDLEIWDLVAFLDTNTISSKFNDGTIGVNFKLSISNEVKLSKQDTRDILLNNILS